MARVPKSTEARVVIAGVMLALIGAALASSGNHIIETIGVFIILFFLAMLWITWFFF